MNLIFDTETTGLPDFRSPSDAPHQPHLVQLAVLLADQAGTEHAAVKLLVKPEGWTIPAEVSAIHGITTEMAEAFGVPEQEAVSLFLALERQCGVHVAHNLSFDRRIMRIALLRRGLTREQITAVEAKKAACTLLATTSLVNLPPTDRMRAAGFNKPKPPKLAECIKHFFGEDFVGAHDAMVDVRACARIFFELQRRAAVQITGDVLVS